MWRPGRHSNNAILIYLVTIWKMSTQNKNKLLCIKSRFFLESASVTQTEIQEIFSGKIFNFVSSILYKKKMNKCETPVLSYFFVNVDLIYKRNMQLKSTLISSWVMMENLSVCCYYTFS